jgi:hypothetical protein
LIRQILSISDLKLPPCPTPRAGEAVVWYNDALQRNGLYVGFGPEAKPIIQTSDKLTVTLDSFDEIRLEKPFERTPPIWSGLSSGQIVRPSEPEKEKFRHLLNKTIPPGPRYIDLIEEIWYRGYEVFLVGGTVRDVVAGGEPHDVDLVTSMPLQHAVPFLTRMFRSDPSIDEQNGYVRLGGPWKDGAPFVDLKSFVFRQPGSVEAVFAGDIVRDHKHRDFACNAIYYDPVNEALLDPSGIGLRSAEDMELVIVCDPAARPPYHRATIAIRFVKFCARGFVYSDTTKMEIQSTYLPALDSMKDSNIFAAFSRQVLNKMPIEKHAQILEQFGVVFENLGAKEVWTVRILPLLTKGA